MIYAAIDNTELRSFAETSLIHTFSKILRVDVNTGKYEIYKDDGLLNGEGIYDTNDIYSHIQKLINDKIVYPEYATICQRFTNPEYVRKSVFSGVKRMVQSYRRRTAEGDKWITCAIIAGENCSPENPMVLYTWREADPDAITLFDTLPTISSLYDKLLRINLTNNTYEPVIVDDDEKGQLAGGIIDMKEWWAGYSKDGNIAEEDMSAFSAITKNGSLQKRFAVDPTPVSFRYRRKVGDEYRWVQLEISPSVEYSENNQIMLLSLKDIHEEYTAQIQSRQELIDNMNTDALTSLFNRLKFNDDIDRLKKSNEPLFTCLYIDANGLHELNNLLGHQKGDNMLCCVADTLRKHFWNENVYRIGGDEFVVTSLKLSADEVESIVGKVRSELLKDNYEISIGIESGRCDENVEKIVAAAETKMREDKANYYMQKGDRRRKRQLNEELEQILVEKHDSDAFLDVIARQFPGVYFVNLESDTIRHIYNPDFFTDMLEVTGGCFSKAVRIYMKQFVKREFHRFFDEVLDYNNLYKLLEEETNVRFTYQKTDNTWIDVSILRVDEKQSSKSETMWIFAAGKR